jgi:hypothetical protein
MAKMSTAKPHLIGKKIQTNVFTEGTSMKEFPFQFKHPVGKAMLTLFGNVVISASAACVPAQTAWPYLLQLFGLVTFDLTVNDSSKGLKMESIPASMLWEESFEGYGSGPLVSDGGMAAASFAAGTYAISVAVPILFFDPRTPKNQRPFTYFRPVRYNAKPQIQIDCGTFFKTTATAPDDQHAVSGTSMAYTLALNVSLSAWQAPTLKMTAADSCADPSYEYSFIRTASPSDFNAIDLADLEVQAAIRLFNTAVAEGVESGINNLGVASPGYIQTRFGADPFNQIYPQDLQNEDQTEFSNASTWPNGWYTIDTWGSSWEGWIDKTCLAPGLAQHLLDTNGGANPGGDTQNLRMLHKSWNLSTSAKAGVSFPPYAGG